jgi:hypothetical protein
MSKQQFNYEALEGRFTAFEKFIPNPHRDSSDGGGIFVNVIFQCEDKTEITEEEELYKKLRTDGLLPS